MTEIKTPTWADVRRVADELKSKMHLAGDKAREKWNELQPKIVEAEKQIAHGGSVVAAKILEIGGALKEIGKDVAEKLDKITHEPPPKS